MSETLLNCRICDAELANTFADLGISPLSNSYLVDVTAEEEPKYELHARVCSNCFLVQLPELQSPEQIFSDYSYFSSFSKSWLEHSRKYVDMMVERFGFDKDSLVVEIASNDGYLLKNFVGREIPVLGVEPAANVAKEAIEAGVRSESVFWGLKTAQRLKQQYGQADLIIGNNVLAHVPDICDFVSGVPEMMSGEGICTFEFPHLVEMMKSSQFDTIYHEHFSYLSLYVVTHLFERFGLKVFDVERLKTHGGSLRVFACHSSSERTIEGRVEDLLKSEMEFGINDLKCYERFSEQALQKKAECLKFFENCRLEGKTVVGYGAPAKGNTFINYLGLSRSSMDYTVDISPHKQNKFLPGSHIPIKSPDQILVNKPDYVFILPWNLREEISQQMSSIRQWGGKFVVAIPHLEIF